MLIREMAGGVQVPFAPFYFCLSNSGKGRIGEAAGREVYLKKLDGARLQGAYFCCCCCCFLLL